MSKILFLVRDSDLHSSFVEFDLSLLKDSDHSVNVNTYPRIPRNPFQFIKKVLNDRKKALQNDYIYSWWLTNWYPALISILSKRPLFVVAGGFDTVQDKQIHYGGFISRKLKRYIRFTVKNAFRVLTINESLSQQLQRNLNKKILKLRVISAGFDNNEWQFKDQPRSGLLSIASNKNGDLARHQVKGIDRFIEAARRCPSYNFTLLGYTRENLKKLEPNIPENLIILEYLSLEDLKKLYHSIKCYCQFSRHEGQPYTVCEAILSGCIVLGSKINGIPDAVKNPIFLHDFTIDSDNSLYQKIEKIMQTAFSFEELMDYRSHILRNFSKEIRQKQLNEVFLEYH